MDRKKIEQLLITDVSVLAQLQAAKRDREAGVSSFIDTVEKFEKLLEEIAGGESDDEKGV